MRNKFERIVQKTELPAWLNEALAEEILLSEKEKTIPDIVIKQKKGRFYTSLSTDSYDTIEEAYNSLTRKQQEEQLVFDQRSLKKHGELLLRNDNTSIVVKNNCRLLMGKTSHNTVTIELLKYAYAEWMNKINPKYQKNPKDWFVAYEWLNNHPAFWVREYSKQGQSNWETEVGIDKTYSFVYKKGRKKFICIETGSHVAPDYKTRYLDIDLTVQEKTFEKAYVELAGRINKQYQIDGSDG